MEPIQIISQDLFDKVRSRFKNLEMGDKNGSVTIDPAEARFFDFDLTLEGQTLGRVSVSLADPGSLKIYYSQTITENLDREIKIAWYNFLREMRYFAKRRLLRFDTRDIAKSNLEQKDFEYLAKTQASKESKMSAMNESRWNGRSSRKTSRAVKGKTEVIVRHNRAVDEMYPGSRSQRKNIRAIFIQNSEGERFKYPFIHPAGAFAMAQHVDHGGVPHDPAGKAIIKMSEEIAKLQEFQRKVHSSSMHQDAMNITERAMHKLHELKSHMEGLGRRKYYERWISEFHETPPGDDDLVELDAVTLEDYKNKFTITNFQEELTNYFPLLHKIMKETNTIDLEDYVQFENNDRDSGVNRSHDAFEEFESWAEAVERTGIDAEAAKEAMAELPQENGKPKLQFGDNASNAIDFFKGIGIDDPDLEEKLKDGLDYFGNDGNALDAFIEWAKESRPELIDELGLGTEPAQPEQPAEPAAEPAAATAPEQPAAAPATPEQPAAPEQPTAENEEMKWTNTTMTREGIVKEVAKIVKSFYNADNESVGPFRAEENIALDCKKQIQEKFGERAGEFAHQLAEQFIEKLTREWQERHGTSKPVDADGLSIDRLRELIGNIKQRVEGIGDQGSQPYHNIMQDR